MFYNVLGSLCTRVGTSHRWKIPWTAEPGGYSPWGCTESDPTENAHACIYTMGLNLPLRPPICKVWEWQTIPVFLPGEFHGRGAWWLQAMGSQRAGRD